MQGGLYSRHRLQRREPDNVRESSEPDNVRNLLSRYAKRRRSPKKGPRLDSPQARPSAKQFKEQAKAHPQSRPPPYTAQLRPPCRAASILGTVCEGPAVTRDGTQVLWSSHLCARASACVLDVVTGEASPARLARR